MALTICRTKSHDEQGRRNEAEPLVLETLATRKRVLGDDHPETLLSIILAIVRLVG